MAKSRRRRRDGRSRRREALGTHREEGDVRRLLDGARYSCEMTGPSFRSIKRSAAEPTPRRRRPPNWRHRMRTIKGPGVFLAQFAADAAPYNFSLPTLAKLAAEKRFKGVQIPSQ